MDYRWPTIRNEFKRCRRSISDEDEMINKVHNIVLAHRRMKVREIVEMITISVECVQNILHTKLNTAATADSIETELRDNFNAIFGQL